MGGNPSKIWGKFLKIVGKTPGKEGKKKTKNVREKNPKNVRGNP